MHVNLFETHFSDTESPPPRHALELKYRHKLGRWDGGGAEKSLKAFHKHGILLHSLLLRCRLISELRRLGACVVFASFQKVIIATTKSDIKAARDYVKFVVSTVTSRDLFNTLQVATQLCEVISSVHALNITQSVSRSVRVCLC